MLRTKNEQKIVQDIYDLHLTIRIKNNSKFSYILEEHYQIYTLRQRILFTREAEAVHSSESLVSAYQTTWFHILEDHNIKLSCSENLNQRLSVFVC
jgi:hypothetical protein